MSFVGVPIISGRMNLSDHKCVIIRMTVSLTKTVRVSLSNDVWKLFLAFILCSPVVMTIFVTKSMISKIVDIGEHGKIFALIGSLEGISSLVASTVMTLLYQSTTHINAGIVFVFEVAFLVVWIPVLCLSIRGCDK